MRKTVIIGLLSLIFISQLGYYFIYSIERASLQSSRQERMKEAYKTTIILEDHSTAITWEQDDQEFVLDGVLYDVESTEKINGKTVMHVAADGKETNLKNEASKTIASNTEKENGKAGKNILKLFSIDYAFEQLPVLAYPEFVSQKYFSFHARLNTTFLDVEKSPPQG